MKVTEMKRKKGEQYLKVVAVRVID